MGLPCGHRSRSATSTPPRPPRSLAPAMRNASGCASTTRSGPSPRDRGRSSTTGRSCSAAAGSNRMPTSHFWVYNSGQEALHVRHVGCPGLSAGDGHPHLPVVSLPLAILVLAYAVGPGSDYPGVYPDTLLIAEAGVRSALRFHIHRIDDLGRGRADAVPHAPRARPETRITTLARATARGGQFPRPPCARTRWTNWTARRDHANPRHRCDRSEQNASYHGADPLVRNRRARPLAQHG